MMASTLCASSYTASSTVEEFEEPCNVQLIILRAAVEARPIDEDSLLEALPDKSAHMLDQLVVGWHARFHIHIDLVHHDVAHCCLTFRTGGSKPKPEEGIGLYRCSQATGRL